MLSAFASLLSLGSGIAHARDALDFTPDRPGVGDSTGTPGRGRVMIEAGVAGAFGGGSALFGTSGITGRVGVDEGLELRLRLPDVVYDNEIGLGTLGVGAKVGGAVGERWSVSFLSELALDPRTGTPGGSLSGNVAVALGDFSLWGHGAAAGDAGPVSVLAGGGIGWGVEKGGAFVNAGHVFGEAPFVGPGAYWMLSEGLQIDAGCDFALTGDGVVALPLAGVVIGF